MFYEYRIRIKRYHYYSDLEDLYTTLVDTKDELRNKEVKKQYLKKVEQISTQYWGTYFQINLLDDNKEFVTTIQ